MGEGEVHEDNNGKSRLFCLSIHKKGCFCGQKREIKVPIHKKGYFCGQGWHKGSASFCFTISANATTGACKVKGTNSTVYVSVVDWSPDGTVQLSIDSDANTRVSFQFFVKYKYSRSGYPSSNTITQSFGAGADPNMSNTKTIRLTAHKTKGGIDIMEIESITVQGAKCE